MNEFTRYANDLLRAATGIDRLAEKAVERVSRGALASAKANAPVDTGRLAGDLTVRQLGPTSRAVETSTYYARFQEWGTSRMAPNPFMGPAVDRWEPELAKGLEGVADEIAKELS